MKVAEYRKQFERQLAASPGRQGREPPSAAGEALVRRMEAGDQLRSPVSGPRFSTFSVTSTASPRAPGLADLISLLGDADQPARVRSGALHELKKAEFFGPLLDPLRAELTRAMRVAARGNSVELRDEALEALIARGDGEARGLLLQGLQDPRKTLVPKARAIQLLGQGDHGDAVPVVRDLLAAGMQGEEREEAMRLLASDPASTTYFQGVLTDRAEETRYRRLAAVGLHLTDPDRYEATARGIVADGSEDDDLRAICLTGLSHGETYGTTRADPDFESSNDAGGAIP